MFPPGAPGANRPRSQGQGANRAGLRTPQSFSQIFLSWPRNPVAVNAHRHADGIAGPLLWDISPGVVVSMAQIMRAVGPESGGQVIGLKCFDLPMTGKMGSQPT